LCNIMLRFWCSSSCGGGSSSPGTANQSSVIQEQTAEGDNQTGLQPLVCSNILVTC
jgi:hypothetical protein